MRTTLSGLSGNSHFGFKVLRCPREPALSLPWHHETISALHRNSRYVGIRL